MMRLLAIIGVATQVEVVCQSPVEFKKDLSCGAVTCSSIECPEGFEHLAPGQSSKDDSNFVNGMCCDICHNQPLYLESQTKSQEQIIDESHEGHSQNADKHCGSEGGSDSGQTVLCVGTSQCAPGDVKDPDPESGRCCRECTTDYEA